MDMDIDTLVVTTLLYQIANMCIIFLNNYLEAINI